VKEGESREKRRETTGLTGLPRPRGDGRARYEGVRQGDGQGRTAASVQKGRKRIRGINEERNLRRGRKMRHGVMEIGGRSPELVQE